jgi:3-isopropylmalate/(R)-2-methylmalate dehydratase small subunit
MMEKFTSLTAIAAPLLAANIDTDIIIPMGRMVTAERDDMHQFAFEPLRFLEDGSDNPEFVLNKSPFTRAEILIVGPNFGCGSSREGAVWALNGLGIRCLIGSGFGEIFYNNCFQNGILPIVLSVAEIEGLAEQVGTSDNAAVVTVDLEKKVIVPSIGPAMVFDIDPNRRQQLLEGEDSISLTLKRADEIDAFRSMDKTKRPWIYS